MAKKLTTGQKVLIGIAVLGGGYVIYRMMTKPKTPALPAGYVPGASLPSTGQTSQAASLVTAGTGLISLVKGFFSSSPADAAPASTSDVQLAAPADTSPVTSVTAPGMISDMAPSIFVAGTRRKKHYMG